MGEAMTACTKTFWICEECNERVETEQFHFMGNMRQCPNCLTQMILVCEDYLED